VAVHLRLSLEPRQRTVEHFEWNQLENIGLSGCAVVGEAEHRISFRLQRLRGTRKSAADAAFRAAEQQDARMFAGRLRGKVVRDETVLSDTADRCAGIADGDRRREGIEDVEGDKA